MESRYVLKKKTIYGISVVDEKGGVEDTIFIIDKSEKEVRDFITLCNTEELEPIHLKNAIDDILYK